MFARKAIDESLALLKTQAPAADLTPTAGVLAVHYLGLSAWHVAGTVTWGLFGLAANVLFGLSLGALSVNRANRPVTLLPPWRCDRADLCDLRDALHDVCVRRDRDRRRCPARG